MPEIIDKGVTGLLVRDVDQAVAAVDTVRTIDRAGCRVQACRRFGANRMVSDYLTGYDQIVGERGN